VMNLFYMNGKIDLTGKIKNATRSFVKKKKTQVKIKINAQFGHWIRKTLTLGSLKDGKLKLCT